LRKEPVIVKTTRLSTRVPKGSKSKSSPNGKRPVGNEILLDLPADERNLVFSNLEPVSLKLHDVLHEPGGPIEFGYFPNGGIVSILSVLSNGKSLEVGLVGREGFVGLPLVVGFRSSPTRAICQASGTAWRIVASALVQVLVQCPKLVKALDRYSLTLGMQASQVAACNGLHEVDERLARWLLMCHDRLGGDSVPLTQEFLSQMLGIRRASVTVAAGILQKAGLIRSAQGTVTILNRKGLEDLACECYGIINHQMERWRKDVR
jgi:CRP-like cAMP-binding protein